MSEAIVVPLKGFERAKERLRQNRDLDTAKIARDLARAVVRNCEPREVIVVCEDLAVSAFASELGAEVWSSAATNLNEAVQSAYEGLRDRYDMLIVVHGDLRDPEGLGTYRFAPRITLFADHRGEGTNVLALPTGLDFHFSYGPGSLRRHRDEALRLGAKFQIEATSPWRFDVDEPSDLRID